MGFGLLENTDWHFYIEVVSKINLLVGMKFA